jgi:hypothetical protein
VAEVDVARRCPGQAEEATMDERVVTRTQDGQRRWIVGAALRAGHDVMNFEMFV